MDVNDRSIRIDVYPGGLASPDPPSPAAATTTSMSSFADSLSQAQQLLATKSASDEDKPAQQQSVKEQPPSDDSALMDEAEVANPSQQTSPSIIEIQLHVATCPVSHASNGIHCFSHQPPTISEPSDSSASLLPGLVVTTAPALPVAQSAIPVDPPLAPPVSLVKALQPVTAPSPAESVTKPVVNLLPIPLGLQAGLVPAGSVPIAAIPAPAVPQEEAEAAPPPDLSQDGLLWPIAAPQPVPSYAATSVSVAPDPIAQETSPPVTRASLNPTPTDSGASLLANQRSASLSTENATRTVGRHEETTTVEDVNPMKVAPQSIVPEKTMPRKTSPEPSVKPDGVATIQETAIGATSMSAASPPPEIMVGRSEASAPVLLTSTGESASPWEQVQPGLRDALLQDRQMTILLRPPELGAVLIDILRHEGQVSARLQTETETAHRLLSEHLPQLRETLTGWGVSADQVQVVRAESPADNYSSTDGPANGQRDRRDDAPSRRDAPHHSPQPPIAEDVVLEEAAAPFIRSRTALNLHI